MAEKFDPLQGMNSNKAMSDETIRKTYQYGGKDVEVIYRKGNPGRTKEELDAVRAAGQAAESLMFNFCAELTPSIYEAAEGVLCYRDVPCRLRDGAIIYSDIYMPKTRPEPIPVILSWSMFGKRPSEGMDEWKLMGVPPQTVSPMAKFESADPGYWCRKGFAIANVDTRGVGNNDGDVHTFGVEDAKDAYDYIEWIALQAWCNGKVGLYGNSGVAMVQWFIAAQQPPHLACIAPWEGTSDVYRESAMVGGIPSPFFNEGIVATVACRNYIEDFTSMVKEHPYLDEYWQTKIPDWSKIRVPAYVCAGWEHPLHLRGSIEGFRRIRSPKKWLRAHREFEWPDGYHRDHLQDLLLFYERYLKDIRNGWEFTPRVRLEVMDAYHYDYVTNRPEKSFPLERTEYKKLYLQAADGTASYDRPAAAAEVVYDPKEGKAVFDCKFTEETEITGFMKLRLWVESRGHDNMDLFCWISKLGQNGEVLPVTSLGEPHRGIWGFQRVSRRELDEKLSTDYRPVCAHQRDLKLSAGEIVPVDIEIWPHSRIWHKGESLRIEVFGHLEYGDGYADEKLFFATDNGDGQHVIHTGGEFDSYLQIPVIPPRYQSGDYVLR